MVAYHWNWREVQVPRAGVPVAAQPRPNRRTHRGGPVVAVLGRTAAGTPCGGRRPRVQGTATGDATRVIPLARLLLLRASGGEALRRRRKLGHGPGCEPR